MKTSNIKAVIQEEVTGCGIAAVANILGKSYPEMKSFANSMGIYASDKSLWSDTEYVRRMLLVSGFHTSSHEIPFESWAQLPDIALLSTKNHIEDGKHFWHWVVFKQLDNQAIVLDSSSHLSSNIRTDFDNIQPAWFIEVKKI